MNYLSTKHIFISILVLIGLSSCVEDVFDPTYDITGKWEEVGNEQETLFFEFKANKDFISYTEKCDESECETTFGNEALWSLDGDKITVNFKTINISNNYTILDISETQLTLTSSTRIIYFKRI